MDLILISCKDMTPRPNSTSKVSSRGEDLSSPYKEIISSFLNQLGTIYIPCSLSNNHLFTNFVSKICFSLDDKTSIFLVCFRGLAKIVVIKRKRILKRNVYVTMTTNNIHENSSLNPQCLSW